MTWLETLIADIRYATRTLRTAPVFALAAMSPAARAARLDPLDSLRAE